jgi:hypothetical protein
LCQRRHPVHRVSQADAVPVYGSRLVEFIDDANRKFLAALGPQTGTRGDAVIASFLHAQDTRVLSRCGGAGSSAKPGRQRADDQATARKQRGWVQRTASERREASHLGNLSLNILNSVISRAEAWRVGHLPPMLDFFRHAVSVSSKWKFRTCTPLSAQTPKLDCS